MTPVTGLQVECDGRPLDLPEDIEGLLLLNINSYMGGVDLWASGTWLPGRRIPAQQSMCDGKLEVGPSFLNENGKADGPNDLRSSAKHVNLLEANFATPRAPEHTFAKFRKPCTRWRCQCCFEPPSAVSVANY